MTIMLTLYATMQISTKLRYENGDKKGLKYDIIKMDIGCFTVKYAKMKAKTPKKEELTLHNKKN